MTKKILFVAFAIFLVGFYASAQSTTEYKKFKVAIFAPLYLDSAFDGSHYNYSKSFPKFTQLGFDFVQGAIIALDSLPMTSNSIIANIYDCKSVTQPITNLIEEGDLDNLDLIVASVKDADLVRLSAFAKQKNIAFVSATSPSDGGNTANPFFVMLYPSLMAHMESIHSFLLQNHGTDKIYLCRRPGSQEDKVAQYLKTINEEDGTPILNIETINFDGDDFSELASKLDSNRSSIVIGGSLNEGFTIGLTKQLYSMKDTYPIELIGMPNWDSFEDLRGSSIKDFPVLFTAAYNNAQTDLLSKKVKDAFFRQFKANPSEMTYKGFEAVYTFVRLVSKYNIDFTSHLNDNFFKSFSEFNFKPVYLKKGSNYPDYFENKHLFLMKLLNGKTSRF